MKLPSIRSSSQLSCYLAASFSSIQLRRTQADQLRRLGIKVTSRWLCETANPESDVTDFSADFLRETAEDDLDDLVNTDITILFTATEDDLRNPRISKRAWARGGRHFEAGFVWGLRIADMFLIPDCIHELVICGPRENVFHSISPIRQFDTWELVVDYLMGKVAEREAETVADVRAN